MNAEDLYSGHPHLMTSEEKEQYEHVDSENGIPTYSPILRDWILFGRITGNEDDDEDYLGMRPSPEAEYRQEFERRPPALGATPALLEELRTHMQNYQLVVYNSVNYITVSVDKCYGS